MPSKKIIIKESNNKRDKKPLTGWYLMQIKETERIVLYIIHN